MKCQYGLLVVQQIIEQCLDIIDELWLNEVEGSYDCDTFLDKEVITNHVLRSCNRA